MRRTPAVKTLAAGVDAPRRGQADDAGHDVDADADRATDDESTHDRAHAVDDPEDRHHPEIEASAAEKRSGHEGKQDSDDPDPDRPACAGDLIAEVETTS